jgi:hypothetical protein
MRAFLLISSGSMERWGGLLESAPNWTFGAVDFVVSVISDATFVDPLVRVLIFPELAEFGVEVNLLLI